MGPAPAGFNRRTINDLLKRVGNLVDVKVTGFISVKPIRKFFKCSQCEAEVEMPTVVPKSSCAEMMRTSPTSNHIVALKAPS